jgi:hypothetical protein
LKTANTGRFDGLFWQSNGIWFSPLVQKNPNDPRECLVVRARKMSCHALSADVKAKGVLARRNMKWTLVDPPWRRLLPRGQRMATFASMETLHSKSIQRIARRSNALFGPDGKQRKERMSRTHPSTPDARPTHGRYPKKNEIAAETAR